MAAPMRLLVVDDDVDFRLLLRHQLTHVAGLEVVADAADGFEALELVDALIPDCVVIDLMMPGMDGFELIGLLQQLATPPGMVAYSAMASGDVMQQDARLGVELLMKSGDHTALIEAIYRSVAVRPADGYGATRVPNTVL
ncbi:MAG: two-component system response regulator (stage 0 sporulation protein A) [Nonlabens sp.]|jgi:two-component system response regulator (stage 0 sporulation protein A)